MMFRLATADSFAAGVVLMALAIEVAIDPVPTNPHLTGYCLLEPLAFGFVLIRLSLLVDQGRNLPAVFLLGEILPVFLSTQAEC